MGVMGTQGSQEAWESEKALRTQEWLGQWPYTEQRQQWVFVKNQSKYSRMGGPSRICHNYLILWLY